MQNKLRLRLHGDAGAGGEVSGAVHTYLEDCWHWAAARSQLLNGWRLAIEALPAVTLCEDCGSTYATVGTRQNVPFLPKPAHASRQRE